MCRIANKESSMKSCMMQNRIRHRVHFAPDPNNTSFPTEPVLVNSRKVSDLTEIPSGVRYIFFDDVVESHIEVMSRPRDNPLVEAQIVYSSPFAEEQFAVAWNTSDALRLVKNDWYQIAVHENLKDKVWVLASKKQLREVNTEVRNTKVA
jgi:hypothetical protein